MIEENIMSFKSAVLNTPVEARTENGMQALQSSLSKTVDLFYVAGASRGKDLAGMFEAAYQEDKDIALRMALWVRDIRGGAGERGMFRSFLLHIEKYHYADLLNTNFLSKIPEVGRWDDLLVFETPAVKKAVFKLIRSALIVDKNGLCAKWMPRKGKIAIELRNFLDLSPRSYRKLLVDLTKVVESDMCANRWNQIEYSHVPSVAMSRYMKAFWKHSPERMNEYKESLVKGETKINSSALYPYQIIKGLREYTNVEIADAQWNSLPNYIPENSSILPMVDVSGSMCVPVHNQKNVSVIDIALSLGLYCADKNTGDFKDLFLTFSTMPKMLHLKGTLSNKMIQMQRSDWAMSTNLHAAFDEILRVAKSNSVPAKDMPKYLLILSDMQFDACVKNDDSAIKMIQRKYREAGYNIPAVIFWNLAARGSNVPVTFDAKGTALVSGFSPAIMKSILAADFETISPVSIMLETLMCQRYDFK